MSGTVQSPTARRRARFATTFVALAAVMLLLPAAPASATGVTAVTFHGNATLNGGIGACANGAFLGQATGLHGTRPVVLGPIQANFNYCDPLIVTGDAAGQFLLDGDQCGFTWLRVGLAAVILIDGGPTLCRGAAVATFFPTSVPGSVPSTALIAGSGVYHHVLLED